ncbi:MAG: hypothetical protein H6581_27495 [Bacteroidia bacterium]|nr:hypothetical protein [Bacteroidia bacterium]
MRIKFSILLPALLLVLFSACKKDDPGISEIPEITLLGVNPTTVIELQDSIVFSVSYRDGDGDLGENDANVKNCFIVDSRINASYGFRIQQLAPDDAVIPIQGNLEIVLPNTGITDGSSSQKTTFDLYIIDRAGHSSNVVTSPEITINQ